MRLPLRALPPLLLLALGAAPAAAQAPAALHGTVRDGAGAPVAGARVEAEPDGAGRVRRARTDDAGRYRLEALAPGRVRVRVEHLAHRTADTLLELAVGSERRHDVVLAARTVVVDPVTVTGRNPALVRPEETGFATEVHETAIRLLPLPPGVDDVVALTPGARGPQVWGGATQQANDYRIDGIAANHPGTGGELLFLSVHWLEAVEVRGLGAGAEHGNFQGGSVNLVTRSGTPRREGSVRVLVDAAALSASNLERHDIAREVEARYEVDGELGGPLVRDRLFYYMAGSLVRRTDRVVNHLRTREGLFAPDRVEALEPRAFAKLTWHPRAADLVSLSGGYFDARVDRFGATGHEHDAFVRATAPTLFASTRYRRALGAGVLEGYAAAFTRDERREPHADPAVPAVVLYGIAPRPTYNAAEFRERLAPSSLAAGGSFAWEAATGPLAHSLKAGVEWSAGEWIHDRIRNGGMTWRPGYGTQYDAFDPRSTATWVRNGFVPLAVGGETRLRAGVRNGAAYLQDRVTAGRLTLAPGIRLGWWTGYLTPAGGAAPRFRAVHDRAWDPRLGASVDLTGAGTLVARAHVGRYHQGLFAQLFDRVEGGSVHGNEQLWYFLGTPDTPEQVFSPAERARLADAGRLLLQEEVRLDETGPVAEYRQPHVDQLVLGVERQMGRWWKVEGVYVGRRNGDMMALVDRNLASNHTEFRNIHVFDAAGEPVLFDGEPVVIPALHLPNSMLLDHLRVLADRGGVFPPGLRAADTLRLTWDPDYVLARAPGARRVLHQAQLVLRMGHPTHGGTASLVYTRLTGNLDNVSGHHESARFAGPYVNPNLGVNAYGWLGNSAELEARVWVYGALPRGFRGGALLTQASGDRTEPVFRLSSTYVYRDSAGVELAQRLVAPVAGQPIYLRRRGDNRMHPRVLLDLHLERSVRLAGAEVLLGADAFNFLGTRTPTRYNTIVNGAAAPGSPLGGGIEPEMRFGAVRERVRPRSLRLGATARF